MQLSQRQTIVAIAVVAVVIVGVVDFMWSHSGPPAPTLGPGQTIKNPFGDAGQGAGGGPRGPAVGQPQGGTAPQVPAAGTYDTQRGCGPSRHIPGQQGPR
jgi:hypothetical protein